MLLYHKLDLHGETAESAVRLLTKTLKQLPKDTAELRQHRTKTALRLSATSACIFSVILHRNPSTYVSMPSEFLYNLTKNLTAHLRHYLCAVLS